jgi:hypothetical protein
MLIFNSDTHKNKVEKFVDLPFGFVHLFYITNLTFHDLVMKTVQNSFIHNLYISCIYIMH